MLKTASVSYNKTLRTLLAVIWVYTAAVAPIHFAYTHFENSWSSHVFSVVQISATKNLRSS
jgi:hypothetical protein